jgi:hypothetical protein
MRSLLLIGVLGLASCGNAVELPDICAVSAKGNFSTAKSLKVRHVEVTEAEPEIADFFENLADQTFREDKRNDGFEPNNAKFRDVWDEYAEKLLERPGDVYFVRLQIQHFDKTTSHYRSMCFSEDEGCTCLNLDQ